MPEEGKGRFVRPRELSPPEVPAYPDDWVTGPPDFVGVGTQRSGTSWWFRQIILHPRVVWEDGIHFKEVHYFDSLAGVDVLTDEHKELYTRYFPRPNPEDVAGEWTPRYSYDPWVIPQVAQAVPDARILLLLRDPVERYVSGVEFDRQFLNYRPGKMGLTLEIIIEQQRERSYYANQVAEVLDAFPRDQVLILQYERCLGSYEEQLARTYDFLGVDSTFRPPAQDNVPAAPPAGDLPDAERADLAREYAADTRRLLELVPEIDVALWPSVRDLV
jgi:sulfotransferase family protein